MTVSESIGIGTVSSYLASIDIANGALYGERLDTFLPVLLCMETDVLDWQNEFNPTDISLQQDANYLYSLCAPYNVEAEAILNENNSGSTPAIIPDLPSAGVYLIPIKGSDFNLNGVPDATHYDDTRIVGKNLAIFWNDVPRYLIAGEFAYTPTGLNILIDGFDAINNPNYEFFIYIINFK